MYSDSRLISALSNYQLPEGEVAKVEGGGVKGQLAHAIKGCDLVPAFWCMLVVMCVCQ